MKFLTKPIAAFQLLSLLMIVIFALPNYAQTKMASTAENATNSMPKAPLAFGLQDGTPVKLRINRTMSSADAKTGESVDFEVLEDVKIGDVTVIPQGGMALATVTEAKPKRRMGRGGKLNINVDYVRLASGEKVPLRAVKETKGGGHTGAMTGAIVATSIVFFPAAPFFLFMKGKDITIPKGTEVTAYVSGDTPLDPQRFTAGASGVSADNQVGISQNASLDQSVAGSIFSSLIVKSDPESAEITIDGKYVGDTPSTLRLEAGEHKISVKKAGFVLWEKSINLTAGGNITVNATLEKNP